MVLYIRQKAFSLADKYNVFNMQQQLCYRVEGELLSLGSKLRLYDSTGREVFYIKQRLTTLFPSYELYKDDQLCAIISKRLTLFKTKFTVRGAFGSFDIQGDLIGMDFGIIVDGEMLGAVRKQLLAWGDGYELYILRHENADFFVTLVIALDNCLHNERG